MSFTYPKSRNFNAPSRMGTSGRTAAAYSLGKMGSGFGSISRIYNFCNSNTGDNNSAIQCVFGVQQQSTPGPGPTPPTPVGTPTIFTYSNGDTVTTEATTIIPALYLNDGQYTREQLVSVTVGDGCLSLGTPTPGNFGDACFKDCINLTSIVISATVEYIGWRCFQGCIGLTSITIPNSVTSLGELAEPGTGGYCFSGCTGLTTITIPDLITVLTSNCFSGCTGLTSITIPETVTTIEVNCFIGCTGLTSVTFINPNNISSIIENMLQNITGPITITFYNCGGTTWSDLNTSAPNVSAYFVTPASKPSNWTYNIFPGAPPP
jgi:hypothetical protein